MSNASSARKLDDELEVLRMWEEDAADDDVNAAATKVGPMSRAFVDQIMFKAQLAESGSPSEIPASGTRPRAARSNAPAMLTGEPSAMDVPVLHAEDEHAPSEPTVVAASAHAELVSMEARGAHAMTPPAMSEAVTPEVVTKAAEPPPAAKSVPAPAVKSEPAQAAARPVRAPKFAFESPLFSAAVDYPAMGAPKDAMGDRRLALQVAIVLGAIGTTVAAALVFVFP